MSNIELSNSVGDPVNLSLTAPGADASSERRRDQPSRSLAAQRMRRHRERRRDGFRCYLVELRESEIDALVNMNLLQREMRNSYEHILDAFYRFLDNALD